MRDRIRRMRAALATVNADIRSRRLGVFLGDVNMCRGWKGLALAAACWFLHVPAKAQVGTYPSPVGAARMPEPIPCTPSPTPPKPPPNLVPGPISPQAAPMGPPNDLSLPYDHTGAFQCDHYVGENGFYAHLGPMALQRNKLAPATSRSSTPTPWACRRLSRLVRLPSCRRWQGVRVPLVSTVSRPLCRWVLPEPSATCRITRRSSSPAFTSGRTTPAPAPSSPRAIDTLFYNPPLTFLAPNMFRLVDQVTLTQGSSLFNAEFNYRRWNSAFAGLDFIFGLRYMRQNDYLGITTQENASYMTSWGSFTPGRDLTMYQVMAHNNIFAPQIGLEYNLPLFKNRLTLCGMGKVALGANYITSDVSLSRANGMTGFNSQRYAWNFGQIYQLSAFADINILERLRLRLGYTSLWMCGVATSVDQVDFNLMGARIATGLRRYSPGPDPLGRQSLADQQRRAVGAARPQQ